MRKTTVHFERPDALGSAACGLDMIMKPGNTALLSPHKEKVTCGRCIIGMNAPYYRDIEAAWARGAPIPNR